MIVLDTHALVWVLDDDPRLGAKARAIIAQAGEAGNVMISAITPWEIAMLVHKGRLVLAQDVAAWLEMVLALPSIRLASLDPAIALDSVRLPGTLRSDPADRVIVATARRFGVPLVTADRALLRYGADGHIDAVDAGI